MCTLFLWRLLLLIVVTVLSLGVSFAKEEDKQAKLFIFKCSSCHTFGEGELMGPDLKKASTFEYNTLVKAITRMRENVGELNDDEISDLAKFLKSGSHVSERIKQETERQEKFQGDSEVGRKLFYGTKPLKKGGLSCISCHTVSGAGILGGGKLGPALNNVFEKYGEETLPQSIESSNWKIMRGVYKAHPITQKEAAHISAFLGSLENKPLKKPGGLFHIAGFIGCLFLFGLMAFFYRNRLKDVRKKLKRN